MKKNLPYTLESSSVRPLYQTLYSTYGNCLDSDRQFLMRPGSGRVS